MTGRLAFNEPPAGYQHPRYHYVVVMRDRDGREHRSPRLRSTDIDGHIGRMHRGFGWRLQDVERVQA